MFKMLTLDHLMEILYRFKLVVKRRYGDVIIDKISIHKSKYIIYMYVLNNNVKVVIDKKRVKVRVYCGLMSLENNIRRILTREYSRVVEAEYSE